MIDREIEVELDVPAGVETAAIHDSQTETVEEQTPGGRPSRRLRDREPPERIERLAPRRDQQRHRAAARPARRGEGGVCRLDRGRRVEPERGAKRYRRGLKDRARRRGRAQRGAARAPRDELAAQAFGVGRSDDCRQVALDERAGQQMTVETRQHGDTFGTVEECEKKRRRLTAENAEIAENLRQTR